MVLLVPESAHAQSDWTCLTSEESVSSPNTEFLECLTNISSEFIPDPQDPVKVIRILFHVMQREEPLSKENFDETNPDHVVYLQQLFTRLESLYTASSEKWCNGQNQGFLSHTDTRIRFQLEGIIYIKDNLGWTDGINGGYCYNTYASCPHEVLNVFFVTKLGSTIGDASQNHIRLFGFYNDYVQSPNSFFHGNILGHEVGHILGLKHAWEDDGKLLDMCPTVNKEGLGTCWPVEDWCTNNNMDYTWIGDHFSPLQMAKMHHTIAISTATSKFLLHEYDVSKTIHITQNSIWDTPRFLYGDIVVETGYELIINCRVTMPPGGRIIVKRGARLIVDGDVSSGLGSVCPISSPGRITTSAIPLSNCDGENHFERWAGIEVWGNPAVSATPAMLDENYALQADDPGVVILRNGAIIQLAEKGIYGQMRGYSWPAQQQHFGGLISVDGAVFEDCRKAVEYISSFPLSVPSHFKKCCIRQTYLDDGVIGTSTPPAFEGVTSWHVSGLTFEDDCNFLSLERGLVLGNAGANISESTFEHCMYGVQTFMTAPLFNTTVQVGETGLGNLFSDCSYGVFSQSTGEIIVKGNQFHNCNNSMVMVGSADYNYRFNQISADTDNALNAGITAINTGAVQNFSLCNTFSNSGSQMIKQGIYYGGNNSGSFFDGNQFLNTEDVFLIDQGGNIGLLQNQNWSDGDQNQNVFSPITLGAHLSEITAPDLTLGLTADFRYYPPSNQCILAPPTIPRRPYAGDCYDPNVIPYYFTNIADNQRNDEFCLLQNPANPPRLIDCTNTSGCLTALRQSILAIDSTLNPGTAVSLATLAETAPGDSGTWSAFLSISPYVSDPNLKAVLVSAIPVPMQEAILEANLPVSPAVRLSAETTWTSGQLNWLDSLQILAGNSVRDSLYQLRNRLTTQYLADLRSTVDSLITADQQFAAFTILSADTSRISREWRIGLAIQLRDSAKISQLLATYPITHPLDIEFRDIQYLFADWLDEPVGWIPSPIDSLRLERIARAEGSQSGYAASLLHLFYGIAIPPTWRTSTPPAEPRSDDQYYNQNSSQKSGKIKVYPNPSTGQFTYAVKGMMEMEKLILMNPLGQVVLNIDHPQNNGKLDLGTLAHGMYLLWAQSMDGTVATAHIIIQP